jgi:hypothetical protein
MALALPTERRWQSEPYKSNHIDLPMSRAKIDPLLLVRLFQQAAISSVRACHARPFQRMCASFNVSLLPKRRANTTWPPVAGLMASGARDANTSALTPW